MKYGAIIPCRKGSKGIPNKNFRRLCGKPLWVWSKNAAVASGVFELIIISSDNNELKFWADVDPNMIIDYTRPRCLSTDDAQLDPLMMYYAEKYPDIEAWVLLQPTSPLRTEMDIVFAVGLLNKYDSVISVKKVSDKYWKPDGTPLYDPSNRKNRQDSPGLLYENGAIYAVKTQTLLDNKCRIAGEVGFSEMSDGRSWQVDTEFDWYICERLLRE